VPTLAMSLATEPWGEVFDTCRQVLVFGALIYLTRNAVLRTRELYADIRASAWDAPSGALIRVFTALPPPSLLQTLLHHVRPIPLLGSAVERIGAWCGWGGLASLRPARFPRAMPPAFTSWRGWSVAGSLLSHHPHPRQRCEVIQDPHALFRTGFWEAL